MQQKNNCANRVTDIPAYAEVVLETHFHHLRKGKKLRAFLGLVVPRIVGQVQQRHQ
jgi:hypothetical protein